MIQWALRPNIMNAIKLYMIDNTDLKDDKLSASNWDILAKIYEFLKPFQEATLSTEGHSHTIKRNLPTFDFLLRHYEDARVTYRNNPFMQSRIETGWQKLNKYYA